MASSSENEPKHRGSLYVAADGQQAVLWLPTGMIPPPTINGHVPLTGTVTFTYSGAVLDR